VISVDLKNRPIEFSDVLRRWQDDPVFRAFFIALLADAPFSAFRWETPPITTASAVRPFEFVLLDSPELASHPDPDGFSEHFGDPTGSKDVVSFPNLNNDSILVVPCPRGQDSASPSRLSSPAMEAVIVNELFGMPCATLFLSATALSQHFVLGISRLLAG